MMNVSRIRRCLDDYANVEEKIYSISRSKNKFWFYVDKASQRLEVKGKNLNSKNLVEPQKALTWKNTTSWKEILNMMHW